MSNLGFFTISGLACAGHTLETKKIWQSWLDIGNGNATDNGRKAIIDFAKQFGFNFNSTQEPSKLAKNAFNYLLKEHPGATKSYIMRQAIINHS